MAEDTPLLGPHGDETTGWFGRVKRRLKDEKTLFARCVRSASPNRSFAAILFLVLFAISLTCTLSRYLTASEPEKFQNNVVLLVIFSFLVVATFICIGLMCRCASKGPSDDDLQPVHRFIRRNMKLFGIIPFYFAIFVFDFFYVIADSMCIDAWLACDNGDVSFEHKTGLYYHVARTIYLGVVLFVCVKFNEAHFYQNTKVLVGLAVVQATNLSVWLDTLLHESAVFSPERNEESGCFNRSDVNVSDHFYQCFSHTTGEYKLLESASPYLYPFIMEYLMLVIEGVADWFFGDARRHDEPAPPTVASAGPSITMSRLQHLQSIASMANEADGGTEQALTTSYVEQHHQSQQEPEATVTPASSSAPVTWLKCIARRFFSDAGRHDGTPPLPTASASSSRPMSRLQYGSIASMTNDADGGRQQVPTTSNVEQRQQPQQGDEGTVRRTSSSCIFQVDAEARQDDSVPSARPNVHEVPTASTIVNHVDVATDSTSKTWYDRCPGFSVVLSVIASFLLVLLGIYYFQLNDINYRNIFMSYRIAYWIALSLAALVGYVASRQFLSGPMNPNAFEYFVILSCIGPIMLNIFTIIASVHIVGFSVPKGLFIVNEVANIIQICTQVVFYAYAKSVQIQFADHTQFADDENNDRELHHKRSIFTGAILYFAICNAFLWVSDSLVETHSEETSWQKQYFDNWPLIYNIFNPVSLVFRFNSFFLFLNVLLDKRPNPI